jgi:hypothetical protein
MKSRRVLRYMCDHCNKGYWEKSKCLRHETMCLRNPERVCGKCKELGVEQRPLGFYSEELSTWYGDADALREIAHGCPLCMLAAKIAADEEVADYEKWTDFDYKAEVKRCEEDYAAKHPEDVPF